MDLRPVVLREGREREHVGLGLVHQRGELGQPRAQRVGDPSPLRRGGLGVVLGEGGGNEGGDDAAASNQVGVRNPTPPGESSMTTREAARSLQRHPGALCERLRYRRATPLLGT
jgi:hypothetical protein